MITMMYFHRLRFRLLGCQDCSNKYGKSVRGPGSETPRGATGTSQNLLAKT